jgi:hypothetical protein
MRLRSLRQSGGQPSSLPFVCCAASFMCLSWTREPVNAVPPRHITVCGRADELVLAAALLPIVSFVDKDGRSSLSYTLISGHIGQAGAFCSFA